MVRPILNAPNWCVLAAILAFQLRCLPLILSKGAGNPGCTELARLLQSFGHECARRFLCH